VRKTFLVWLFAFLTIAFVSAFIISFSVLSSEASKNAHSLIRLKITDVERQLSLNNRNLADIRKELDENALAKAYAVAEMIKLNSSIMVDQEELERIRKILSVDEIHVSDANGILVSGTVKEYIGYDYSSDSQSAAFLPAITENNFELAQDPLPKGINKEMFQYAGVSRIDSPGIVQIGYTPQKLIKAMEVADIKNLAQGFRVGSAGKIIISDMSGTVVSSSDSSLVGNKLSEIEWGKGYVPFRDNRITSKDGSFVAQISAESYLFEYKKYEDFFIIGMLPASEMYLSRDSSSVVLVIFNMILFILIFFLIAKLVQGVVINGIYRVNRSLEKITKGNLEEVVSVRTNKEFILLSDMINSTVKALKDAVAEAAARIDSELAFAKAIQLSALPSHFPAFPERSDFDVYAQMYTAKEVGGDFYDYFLIDSNRLGFVIADVSGKGIPAALFMMISKSLLKTYSLSGIPLSQVLYKANNSLCENNEANMFVTVFMAVLDLKESKLYYSNAGHNAPLIKRKDGAYEWLKVKNGFVMAGMENINFAVQEIDFFAGDEIFLYTDGVTEAVNKDEKLFSDERLLEVINKVAKLSSQRDTLNYIKEEVDLFADGAEQADDITMLTVKYFGNN